MFHLTLMFLYWLISLLLNLIKQSEVDSQKKKKKIYWSSIKHFNNYDIKFKFINQHYYLLTIFLLIG